MRKPEIQEQLLNLVRAEFQRERESDFALLRQIPSTGVRRFLDYFCSLNRADADLLAESSTHSGLNTFFPYDAKQPPEIVERAYERFRNAPTGWRESWKYMEVRLLRGSLAFANANPEFDNIPVEVRTRIESIKPVKSPEIRRVVKVALGQVISPLAMSHVGGLWQYDGLRDGKPITVNIDYGQRYAQIQYGITHPFQRQEIGKVRVDLSYEGLLGVGRGDWDCLEQANLDQSIALLKDLIIRCDRFLRTLLIPDDNSKSTNKPDSVNPAITSRLHSGYHWRGVTDPGR